MKRILIALALLAFAASPALAQTGTPKTKGALNTEIGTNFPDNTTGSITPSILRQTVVDMVASWQQYGGVSAQIAANYTIQASDYGQLVTVTNASPIAVTLPQATGSFQTFSFFLKNIGATTATITPITSTINGAASLTVGAGNAVYVVSDGANWQAVSFAGGGGTQTIASGALALSTSAIASAACTAAQTATATGTATTDTINATFNADVTGVTGYIPSTAGMLTIIFYPTANTVNFKVCNNTAASITPGAVTINWRVVR